MSLKNNRCEKRKKRRDKEAVVALTRVALTVGRTTVRVTHRTAHGSVQVMCFESHVVEMRKIQERWSIIEIFEKKIFFWKKHLKESKRTPSCQFRCLVLLKILIDSA